jgi:hypothetical protein
MFSTITALSLFMALGLLEWLPARLRAGSARILSGLLFLLAATVLFTSIAPAYRRPAPTVMEVPPAARPVNYDFGGVVRLLAAELEESTASPGEYLPVTLYWQALQPIAEDYSVFVHLHGLESTLPLAQVDVYPVDGSYPTSWWKTGEIIQDRILVPIDAMVAGPRPAWMSAGLFRLKTGENLVARNAEGQEVFPLLGTLQITTEAPSLTPSRTLDANLANVVRLTGFDLVGRETIQPGDELVFTLYWQTLEPMDRDYKVFIHLVDEAETIVAQGDALPTADFYPTSQWLPGEIINDTHRSTIPTALPTGRYRLLVGLYDPGTGQRLPVLAEDGQPVDDRVLVTSFQVPAGGIENE